MRLRKTVADATLLVLASLEQGFDAVRYGVLKHRRPKRVQILCYIGQRNAEHLHAMGRVVRGRRDVARGDDTLSRLRTMLDIYESDEVPGVALDIRVCGRTYRVKTDDEGYFRLALEGLNQPLPAHTQWEQAVVRAADGPSEEGANRLPILAPGRSVRLGIISDIDDTIIETGATNVLKNWRRVLIERPEDRLVVPGAQDLYQRLALRDGAPANPVFYVSSSPWNLHGFLVRFMELNQIPLGPLFLRDYGLSRSTFIAGPHIEHKIGAVETILGFYPDLRFVLIGDNGQKDIEVYAKVVRDCPGAVAGVIIRDVGGTCRQGRNGRLLDQIEAAGIPVFCGDRLDAAVGLVEQIGADQGEAPLKRATSAG